MGNFRKTVIRTCPWCGKVIKKHFSKHLWDYHYKTIEDYCIKINNLIEVPTCKFPGCPNKVGMTAGGYENFNLFCSRGCEVKYRSLTGNHHLSHENRKVDEFGRDLIMKGVTDRGNNSFSKENRKLTEDGKDFMAIKASITRSKNHTNPFFKENLKVDEFGNYVIHKKAHEARIANHSYTRVRTSDKLAVLYLGLFDKESLVKIGTSSDINKRLHCFKEGNIIFSELVLIEGTEAEVSLLEKSLVTKFNNYTKLLDIVKYPNPKGTYMTLGHTEWFSDEIWDLIEFDNL